MKSKKLIISLTLTLTLILGVSGIAMASETNTNATTSITQHQALGISRVTGVRGYDYVTSILKNKLGLTDKEITDGLNSGKTIYDLAKSKGMTEEQFQTALLEEKSKSIDGAVTKGTITKEQGITLKETLKNNQGSCTGNFGQGNINSHRNMTDNLHGNGGGMMGRGRNISK